MTHHNYPPHNQPPQQNPYGNPQPQYAPSPGASQNPYASAPQRPRKEMHRSLDERWLGGVCGGLAQYMGWSPNLVRLLFVLSILIPGPQVIYYISAWIIVPEQGENALDKFKF